MPIELPTAPFEDETEDLIRERMLEQVSPDLDKRQGSYIWDSLSPAAIELDLAYIRAGEVLDLGFIQTSYGKYIDARAEEKGIFRKAAVKAQGFVVVTGNPNALIPSGTVFSTESDPVNNITPVEFISAEDYLIPNSGFVVIPIEAREAGLSGNQLSNKVKLLAEPVSGVVSVNNPEPITGGTDEESDEAFLDRYLETVRHPVTGGCKADYVKWAKEVAGVGDVLVIPLWNGNGTVKVVITDSTGNQASQELIDFVQQYIDPNPGMGEGKAPIGAKVTVVTPTIISINVSAVLTIDSDYNPVAVKTKVEESIQILLMSIKMGQVVRYSAVINAIYTTPGVDDYSDVLVNGSTDNITLAADQKPAKGVVTLS